MAEQSLLLGRLDVVQLLGIPEWQIANFASRKYPYRLAPSVRGKRGRGKKGLYSLADIYKIALAHRMVMAGLGSAVVSQAIRELFPKGADPIEICVRDRPTNAEEARYVVIDLSLAPWIAQRKLPEEWRGQNPEGHPWVHFATLQVITHASNIGELRTAFFMPFDELLNWVDGRILGRDVGFERPAPVRVKTSQSRKRKKPR
jgi:hypothetical protein